MNKQQQNKWLPDSSEPGAEPPLVVDLDGTLLNTDMLHESFLSLLSGHPLKLFDFPGWSTQGLAYLKQQIARFAEIDFDTLPLNESLVTFLRSEKAKGRILVLATASDLSLAEPIAGRLDLFDRVLASDGHRNLKGPAKADALVAEYGEQGFDYAGNDAADLAIWAHARRVIAVNCAPSVLAKAHALDSETTVFPRDRAAPKDYLRALRVHQWSKNLLIFLPILAAHQFDQSTLTTGLLAFVAFSLCASSVYLVNDLFDLTADRRHASKCTRPVARGAINIKRALVLSALLLVSSTTLAWQINTEFLVLLGLYCILTSAYSFFLKRIVLVDVFLLAALYTLRVFSGGAAVDITVSFWLLALSVHLFLSLAMIKRYAELKALDAHGKLGAIGRGYRTEDLGLLSVLGGASGYLAVMVLALYINSQQVTQLYASPALLWLICLLLLFWVSRMWLLAHRGEMEEDPVLFTLRDPVSLFIGLASGLILLAAA